MTFIKNNYHNKLLGNRGEAVAKKYYMDKGFIFLQENSRTRNSEIDLIFEDVSGHSLLFVEVKTLEYGEGRNLNNLTPEDNFGYKKQKMFRRGIEQYLFKANKKIKEIRIDLACVYRNMNKIGETGEWSIKVYQNIILE